MRLGSRLRGELNAGRMELKRQQHDQLLLEQQIGEAGAQLRDSDLQKANIHKLATLAQVGNLQHCKPTKQETATCIERN